MTSKISIGTLPIISEEILKDLKSKTKLVSIKENDFFSIENTYYLNKFPGTINKIYVRESVKQGSNELLKV